MTRRASPSGSPQQPPTGRSRHPKLWILRDPETLELLFQTFEDLATLRRRCGQNVRTAQEEEHLFGHLLWNEDQSGFQRWSRLSEIVTASWRLLDQTVRTNRLDPGQFHETYRKMLWIRTAWARLDPQPGSLRLIDQITDHLRRLLISYAQARALRRPQL